MADNDTITDSFDKTRHHVRFQFWPHVEIQRTPGFPYLWRI